MTPERWQRVQQIFHAALEVEAQARAVILDQECKDDTGLRREVESLIAAYEKTGSFIDKPAYQTPIDLLRSESALKEGETIAHYEILSLLGSGGMGEVYLARDTKLGRKVALKFLPAHLRNDPTRLMRFEQEARSASALNHPNILTIHEIGESESRTFIVTEFVDGLTLRQRIARSINDLSSVQESSPLQVEPLSLSNSLEIAEQIALALIAAHEAGIIHRDIKPENIMLRNDGMLKVLDFGLAKLTKGKESGSEDPTRAFVKTSAGVVMGTVTYMSPEQARGLAVDARTDIWSLGVVLYELIVGRPPFTGATVSDLIAEVLRSEPEPLTIYSDKVTVELERVVRKALCKDLDQRYQTVEDLLKDLRKLKKEIEIESERERPGPDLGVRLTTSEPIEQSTPSLAVLPFTNLSSEKENEYFSDGLSEELIIMLARVQGIRVAGRTSSFFFRGKDVELREIGRRLNVDYILEGSVRKSGNRIRVTAELVKVVDGFHLWSDRYEREMTDIFAIQDEVTLAIAESLRVKLSSGAGGVQRYTPDLRAYELYIKAREEWAKASPESLERVKNLLERAVELDPNFALPHSLMGLCFSMQAGLGMKPAREAIPLARAAEREALRLAPTLPEAHALLGCWAASFDYDWTEARKEWQLAMTHEPVAFSAIKSSDIKFWYGNHYLLPIGQPLDALAAEEQGLREDPLNHLYRHHFAVALRDAGRLEQAETELLKIIDMDPMNTFALSTLGIIYAQQDRIADALALTERSYELLPWSNGIKGQLAALLVRNGAASRASALIDQLNSNEQYGAPLGLAIFHALCGEFDRAAHWTERAFEERNPGLIEIIRPLLGTTPQWTALKRLMNLPG